MNAELFSEAKTGRLIRITIGEPDWAFIPDPLPDRYDPHDLWPELAKAREDLARLDGIGRVLPDPELLIRPLQSREAIRSSSLEGTYASAEELLLFELRPQQPAAASDRVNDRLEVYNYAAALRHGAERLNQLPLSRRLIREMHQVLLRGVRGRDRAPGEFRRAQVHLGHDRRYVPPPPNELDACLDRFERFLNFDSGIDPLLRTFMAHYQFEAIHPFIDGNGRIGRVLLALTAFQWCGLSRPLLYLSPFFDRHKDEYIDALFAVSTNGEWDRWLRLCLRGTSNVCVDALERCDRLVSLRNEYQARADRTGTRAHTIVEGLFSSPIVRITDVAKRLGITYPTAKTDVEKLVELEILSPLREVKPKAFVARRIFDAAYGEPG